MHQKSALSAAVLAAAGLLATAGQAAASGHACAAPGGAAGCSLGNQITNPALTLADAGTAAADDFRLVAGANNLRCTRFQGTASMGSDGGPTYPIGGTGPVITLTALTVDNGTPATKCTGAFAGASVTATVSPLDTNGASAGLAGITGSWNAGAPFLSAKFGFSILLSPFATTCTYATTGATGTVTNAATGRVTFTSQPLIKQSGIALCPPSMALTVPVNVLHAGGPVYLTA